MVLIRQKKATLFNKRQPVRRGRPSVTINHLIPALSLSGSLRARAATVMEDTDASRVSGVPFSPDQQLNNTCPPEAGTHRVERWKP